MTPLQKYQKKLDSLSMLNKNLSSYRDKNDLTHKDMANLLGLPKRRYSSYEYGIAEPSLKVAKCISDRLGIDLVDLIVNQI